MKKLCFLMTMLLAQTLSAQIITTDLIVIPEDPDSCYFSVHSVATKEMILPGEQEYERELNRVSFSKKDIKSLQKRLANKSSTDGDRAMLTHYNLMFDFFLEGEEIHRISISTITGNISVKSMNEGLIYYGRVSKSFGNYLIKQLESYELISLIDESQLSGLTFEYE